MVIGIASVICALLVLFAPAAASGQSANRSPQSEVRDPGFDSRRLELIGPLVEEAIRDGRLPGAVVVAGRRDKVLYRRAFGQRAVTPVAEPMTLDTIFDVASLTKVVATTTAVMALVEDGKIRLNDRVSAYITGFERYGKDRITIRHLLTHVSGLRPDLDLGVSFDGGAQEAIRQAIEEVPVAPPNERLIYSDIGFFLLGHIVEVVSQQRLDQFLQSRVFGPLGMTETTFLPQPSLSARIAPTEACEPLAWPCGTPGASMLRGVVHDPTARRMLGVAGHAGLFSTGEDLATFARMILGGGSWNGARILAPLTVAKMSRPATPAAMRPVRGLGWDIDTPFSSNRGELLPVGSFGHTGFTGTSIWIDPVTETFVIFLSNRVHPDGSGDVTPLRARISTVVASAVTDVPVPLDASLTGTDFGAQGAAPQIAAPTPVLTGIDVLRAESFARLKGRKIGLVTNHTGRAGDGTPTIDLLHEHKDLTVVSLFSPEHRRA
jgi:CubicO group peptidase (beta-lactamase class C family)